jgi:predicted RNase H-like HicB family nuclease
MSLDSGTGSENWNRPPGRPFDSAIWSEARKIIADYRILMERHGRLGFVASSIDLPNVVADGETPQRCYEAIQNALNFVVATMLEEGEAPPEGPQKRTAQVNVRLTPREKDLLSSKSKELGFRGISDFIRTTSLQHSNAPH